METTEIQTSLPKDKSTIMNLDWESTPIIDARRVIAQGFETFVVACMNKGQVSAEEAQKLAGRFVEIFKPVETPSDLQKALDTIHHSDSSVLAQYALKVKEAQLRNLTLAGYNAAVQAAEAGNLQAVHTISDQLHAGKLTSRKDVMQILSRSELENEVNKLSTNLLNAGFAEAAENLKKGFAENRVNQISDLMSFQELLEQKPKLTSSLKVPPQLQAQERFNFNTWLHQFDARIRAFLSKPKTPKN